MKDVVQKEKVYIPFGIINRIKSEMFTKQHVSASKMFKRMPYILLPLGQASRNPKGRQKSRIQKEIRIYILQNEAGKVTSVIEESNETQN